MKDELDKIDSHRAMKMEALEQIATYFDDPDILLSEKLGQICDAVATLCIVTSQILNHQHLTESGETTSKPLSLQFADDES